MGTMKRIGVLLISFLLWTSTVQVSAEEAESIREDQTVLSTETNETEQETFNYYYDENGQIVAKTCQELESIKYYILYEYDENGNPISEIKKWPSSGEKETYLREYDEHGNIIKEDYSNNYYYGIESGILYQQITGYTYSYDETGNIVKANEEKSTINEEGFQVSIDTSVCDYNSNGKLTKKVSEDEFGIITENNFEYDEKGNCIRETISYDSGVPTVFVRQFDENNNILMEEIKCDGDLLTAQYYRYTYDGQKIKSCERSTNKEFVDSITTVFKYDLSSNLQFDDYENRLEIVNANSFSNGYAWLTVKTGITQKLCLACLDKSGNLRYLLKDEVTTFNPYIGETAYYETESSIKKIINSDGVVVASSESGNFDEILATSGEYYAVSLHKAAS